MKNMNKGKSENVTEVNVFIILKKLNMDDQVIFSFSIHMR